MNENCVCITNSADHDMTVTADGMVSKWPFYIVCTGEVLVIVQLDSYYIGDYYSVLNCAFSGVF